MKILFFDYWLKGVVNFTRLAPIIEELYPGAELKMLHTASWQLDNVDVENDHGLFKSFDSDFYGTSSLYRILKKELPDVVVTLNNYFLLDKAVNIFCRKLGIKVIYLSHGRLGSKRLAFSLPSAKRNVKKLPKFNRMNRNMLWNYFLASLMEWKPQRFFTSVYKLFKKPATMLTHSLYNDELKTDGNLVYYKSCRDVLIDERCFPSDEVKVMGNPELDDFINAPTLSADDFYNKTGMTPGGYVLYMDDGTIQSGVLTEPDWKGHIKELNSMLKEQGLKLVIKFHPRTDVESLKQFITEEDIVPLNSNENLKGLVFYSHVVISLYSTTITYALYMRKPVLSPRWGVTEHLERNYPDEDVRYITTAKDFSDAVKTIENHPYENSFYFDNCENFDGKSLQRIASEIINVAAQ